MTSADPTPRDPMAPRAIAEFERTLDKLEATRAFAKGMHQTRLFSLAVKLLQGEAGIEAMYRLAPRFDAAGVFEGGDWAQPAKLEPALVRGTLTEDTPWPALECLNLLRFLALACGRAVHAELDAAEARAFLDEVLARNLDFLFPEATEADRLEGPTADGVRRLFAFIAAHIGTAGIVDALVAECEGVLLQRPIMVQRVEDMLRAVRHALPDTPQAGREAAPGQARWMLEAFEGPSLLARELPEPAEYRAALAALDEDALAAEAAAFGRRMNESGLVSPAHATLLRFLAAGGRQQLLADCLALTRVGRTSLAEYRELVAAIVERVVWPDTRRCIYGLSRLLNRGILFFQPVPPGLQHLMVVPIEPAVAALLARASDLEEPPEANVLLLAGTLSVIGQPRGVDQGHNPTCQAARAISLWSQNDVGYLLELIAQAAVDDDVVMHFEGEEIRSRELAPGLAGELHTELDAVSLVLTPHLDRIYMEMSRRTAGRGEDGHKWVNPEFHGWWVERGFASVFDAHTGAIRGFDDFMRCFYAAYHPAYNGGRELVYAQPCGIVSTSSGGEFIGRHAVSIERVARDPEGTWRVYFFNPNRDKVQNWGQEIVTSICNHGEWEGESSLPFEQFAMRLYVFHYDEGELGDIARVPEDAVARIRAAVAASWAAGRVWLDAAP